MRDHHNKKLHTHTHFLWNGLPQSFDLEQPNMFNLFLSCLPTSHHPLWDRLKNPLCGQVCDSNFCKLAITFMIGLWLPMLDLLITCLPADLLVFGRVKAYNMFPAKAHCICLHPPHKNPFYKPKTPSPAKAHHICPHPPHNIACL